MTNRKADTPVDPSHVYKREKWEVNAEALVDFVLPDLEALAPILKASRLTQDKMQHILDFLAVGATRRGAFGSVGIDWKTGSDTLKIGRMVLQALDRLVKEDSAQGLIEAQEYWRGLHISKRLYATFYTAVLKAEAKAEEHFVQSIYHAAGQKQFIAAIFWLKTRRPNDFSERQTIRLETEQVSEQTQKELEAMPSDELARLYAESIRGIEK